MIYSNPEHTTINDNGTFIPCVPGNSDYDRIVREGRLGEVLPYEAPAEIKADQTRIEALEAALIEKGLISKQEIDIKVETVKK